LPQLSRLDSPFPANDSPEIGALNLKPENDHRKKDWNDYAGGADRFL
jgi:hypothetical protein